jgi:hypothetical protein
MSVLAEFTVPADEFVLTETLRAVSGMRVEIKRVVAGDSTVTPYFWAADGDLDAFEAALEADEMVETVLPLEEQDDVGDDEERFYRVTWEMPVPNLVTAVAEAKATVLEAVSDDGETWAVKVLFPTEDALSRFYEYATAHDFGISPTRVYHPENPQEMAEYGVTDEQQAALETAFHAGYFEVPRKSTLTEIADEMGLSRNALSARLRRGHRNLLAHTLVHEE